MEDKTDNLIEVDFNENEVILSKGNKELEQLAGECIEHNWRRFCSHLLIKKAATMMDIGVEPVTKQVLKGIIGVDEHWSYIDSEYRSDEEPPLSVVQSQFAIRSIIYSTHQSDINRVNRLITAQLEDVFELAR
ncbi:hypothetical protein [Vibrio sp. ER1A]|uniref:hypothetical protein n=1 Tax=Vibrio sp. ER1A TaxID=1517681 RepID=UPI0004DD6237|nr:hypothetical protein [Vibrio sp. ER1A]KFA99606.1 hypothetical protein HW45_02645 [Vibrio sp. ER1A]